MSMKMENDKLQKTLKEAKKESKKAKQDLESTRTDYDIAKDAQTDNENIAKKTAHLRERANKLELQNLEEHYDKDINDLRQQIAHYEDENHMLDMKNMKQRKTIEANTAGARLKEEKAKYKIKLAENQGQFEYMRSKSFTNPEKELKKVFSDQLKEEEMNRCLKSRDKLDEAVKKSEVILGNYEYTVATSYGNVGKIAEDAFMYFDISCDIFKVVSLDNTYLTIEQDIKITIPDQSDVSYATYYICYKHAADCIDQYRIALQSFMKTRMFPQVVFNNISTLFKLHINCKISYPDEELSI